MLTEEQRQEIEEHLKCIGTILLPMIQEVSSLSNKIGFIYRSRLADHEYGELLESFFNMVSIINPQVSESGKIKSIPKPSIEN